MRFTIQGEPQGKGRPRASTRNNRTIMYTPEKTVDYEKWVRLEYKRQCGNFAFDKGVPLKMCITAYFKIPQSVSKKKYKQMLDGVIRPTKKPDVDNIVKVIADALNGIAYYDDAQIVEVVVKKYYCSIPDVSVSFEEV